MCIDNTADMCISVYRVQPPTGTIHSTFHQTKHQGNTIVLTCNIMGIMHANH